MKDSSGPLFSRGRSVQQDWRSWLPEEKAEVFFRYERHLETLYNMFSISLNEAIELRHAGLLAKSLSAIGMTSELCERLARSLAGMLRALYEHAKHYGTVPNTAALDPANYQGQRGQRSARMSSLLGRVLFSHRLQFLHKVGTLGEMVEDLDRDFRQAAENLAYGPCLDPESEWDEVDAGHYDLNTCLRETIVLFKSFLVVLPAGELGDFQKTVLDQSHSSNRSAGASTPQLHRRRMSAFAGQ